MSSARRGIQLRVAEARPGDAGRKIVRIDSEAMERIGIGTGDFVEIEGRKITVAIAWPSYMEDEGLRIIRMDGLMRHNAGVSIGDYVTVRRADVKPATKVVLAPSEPIMGLSENFKEYLKSRVLYKPLARGDAIDIPILGTALRFIVVSTAPTIMVQVTDDTEVIVKEEPVKGVELEIPRVTYEDIGDLEEAKQKIREMVELPLKHPELFRRLGIEPPKGILLYGPPGCGKTLLAKAVANEVGAHFIAINGPEIMSKFYGESEARLREIFKEAEENAPSIIFIDEIDAIAPKRSEVTGEVERRVVSQLLTLMDGLKSRGKVIVIAATNRPNAIDPALRRVGRFDREIEFPVPDRNGRLEILKIHTRNMPLDKDVDLKELAKKTEGFSGADLEALCKEAGMNALREDINAKKVKKKHFEEALKKITPSITKELMGYYEKFSERRKIIKPKEEEEVSKYIG